MGVDYDVCSACNGIFNDHADPARDACQACAASFCGECAAAYVHYDIVDPDGQPYSVPLDERVGYDSTGCALCTKDASRARLGHADLKAVRLLEILLGGPAVVGGGASASYLAATRAYTEYRSVLQDAPDPYQYATVQWLRASIASAAANDDADSTTSASVNNKKHRKA